MEIGKASVVLAFLGIDTTFTGTYGKNAPATAPAAFASPLSIDHPELLREYPSGQTGFA